MTQSETTGQRSTTGYDPPDGSPQLSIEDLGAPRPADTLPEEVEEPVAVDSLAMSDDDILAAARGDKGGTAETVTEEEDASEAVEESPPRDGKVRLGLIVVLSIVLGLVFAFGQKPIFWLLLLPLLFTLIVFIKLFYETCKMDEALVRSGAGGVRVAIQGGMWRFPIIHKFQRVTLRTLQLEVRGRVTSPDGNLGVMRDVDSLPINLDADVFVRVPCREEYILAAATTLGEKIDPTPFKHRKRVGRKGDADLECSEDQAAQAILELFEPILRSAVGGAAAIMTLGDMHANRVQFTENVSEQLQQTLKENGLGLEAFTIESLDQEPLDVISNPADQTVFDANGNQTLTVAIKKWKR